MSKKISEEEFVERVKNMDWSSSKLKPLEPNKLDLVLEKLDKIIDLLTPPSVTSSNETRKLVVERNIEGKKLREGLMNDDGTVEWTRTYSWM